MKAIMHLVLEIQNISGRPVGITSFTCGVMKVSLPILRSSFGIPGDLNPQLLMVLAAGLIFVFKD